MFACRRKRGSVENAKERPQEQRDTVRINLGLVRSETASCVRTREVIRSTFLSGVRVFEKSFLFFLQKFQQIYILKKQVYNFILPQGEKGLHTLQYNFEIKMNKENRYDQLIEGAKNDYVTNIAALKAFKRNEYRKYVSVFKVFNDSTQYYIAGGTFRCMYTMHFLIMNSFKFIW